MELGSLYRIGVRCVNEREKEGVTLSLCIAVLCYAIPGVEHLMQVPRAGPSRACRPDALSPHQYSPANLLLHPRLMP